MFRALVATMVTMMVFGFSVNLARAQALTCSQFASQAEAQAAYAADPTDPAGNDEDGDGVACEDVIYGNTATDFTAVQAAGGAASGTAGIGAGGLMGGDAADAPTGTGIGATGITVADAPVADAPVADAPVADAQASGIGASGLMAGQTGDDGASDQTRDERRADRQAERGVGASGTTRDQVAGSMTAMPDTGVGTTIAGSWAVAAAVLAGAMLFGVLAATSAQRVRND